MKSFLKMKKWLIFVIGGVLILSLFLIYYFSSERNLKIIFLNVGQGDAILIRTIKGENILIDGGPNKNIIFKLDSYIPFYERKIDLMILTHPDPDHLNGLVEVLKRYPTRKVFYNGVKDNNLTYSEFLKIIEEKKIEKEVVWLGKNFEFKNGKIEIFYPFENLSGLEFKNDNDSSIVFKLTYGKIRILFTGDATKKIEEKLIENNLDLEAEILKVAHHGSKDSTSLNFLEKVKPIYAVISVGENKFGHPSLRVLKNLEKIKTKVLRTDQLDDIIFETNGVDLKLKNYERNRIPSF
jgi:competence protein ComEC